MVGMIAEIEPVLAERCAIILEAWLFTLIQATMRASRMKDPNRIVYRQLMMGVRVIGRASLLSLEGRIMAEPWLFAQEYGADIKPVESKMLAIPVFYALRADGSLKFQNPSSWRRFGSFVYTQKETGQKFLAYKGAAGDLRLLYILVDRVKLKPILGLNRTAELEIVRLISAWGQVFVQLAAESGVINLWGIEE
jgi:hypothetical protein